MNAKQTIWELIEEKGNAEAKLYSEAFDLGASAGQVVSQELYAAVEGTLGPAEARKVRAGQMQDVASTLRAELLDEVLRINHRFDEAKVQRQEALEAALDPEVSTEAKLSAVMAGSEQLTALADLSLSTGDDDGVLLALRVARQRGLEDVEAHIRTVRPDLNEICGELDYIEELPAYDEDVIEARFNSVAPGVPSRDELLRSIAT